MSIFVSATTKCNLGCTYCYENPGREVTRAEVEAQYDIEKVMDRLEEFRKRYPDVPGVHGGEPLLMDNEDLERILEWSDQHYDGTIGIQTNGILIDDETLDLLAEYEVSVGVSVDGPAELNDLRQSKSGSVEATRAMTQKARENILKLAKTDGPTVGVIVVLTEQNAGTDAKLEKLLNWIDWLNHNSVSGHYNPAIPYEETNRGTALSPERLKEVYLQTWEWLKRERYRKWDPFDGFVDELLGFGIKSCSDGKCDLFNTDSGKLVSGDGETTGCGRTWGIGGDGARFLQGVSAGNGRNPSEERYEVLKQKPGPHTEAVKNGDVEDLGGCKGCRYWSICHGGCPAQSLDRNYRNRARTCKARYAIYEQIEKDLRGAMDSIRLITDVPWDQQITPYASRGLDIKPFGHLRFDLTKGVPSAKNEKADLPTVEAAVQKAANEMETDDNEPFEGFVERYLTFYGAEDANVDWENKQVRVETDQVEQSLVDQMLHGYEYTWPSRSEAENDGEGQ